MVFCIFAMRLLLGLPRVDLHQIALCNFWIRTRASPPLTNAVTPKLLWKLVCDPMPTTVFRVAFATTTGCRAGDLAAPAECSFYHSRPDSHSLLHSDTALPFLSFIAVHFDLVRHPSVRFWYHVPRDCWAACRFTPNLSHFFFSHVLVHSCI
jgi:hypothetical protein